MSQASNESASRSSNWARLEELTRRAASAGVASLTEQELWEFPSLYRRTLADLSLLRASGLAAHDEQRLSYLCNQAHALIYAGRQPAQPRSSFTEYLLDTLPGAFQRRMRYILAAAAIMLLFSVLGAIHCAVNPGIVERVMPAQMFRGWQAELETARSQKDLRLAAQIEKEERGLAAFQITTNNIRVAAMAIVAGIMGGLPALIILGFNGYMVGVIGFVYFTSPSPLDVNLPLYFIAGIAPHGSIELPAICVASGAGMLVGFSWLFPGQRHRGEALRAAMPDALRLLAVCALTLLVAGAIEGFVTPLNPPTSFPLETWFWLKIGFGGLVFAGWLAWLCNPRRQRRGTADTTAI
jgi:uncharacterized membrane protein SpoIIM required for sporulation